MGFQTREIKSPLGVQFELTYECNNYCTFCYNVWKEPEQMEQEKEELLSFVQIKDILDRLKAADVFRVAFTGGEPTLHPDFLQILEYAQELDLPYTFSTNGNLMTPEYVQKLKDVGLPFCQISLHGSTAEKHERFTQVKGSFDKTIAGMKNLQDAGIGVNVNMTVNRANMDDILETGRLVRDLGARSFSITRFVISGCGTENQQELSIEVEDLDLLVEELARAEEELGIQIRLLTPLPLCSLEHPEKVVGRMSKCNGGFAWFTVSPSGEVRLCTNSQVVVGDLKTHSVEEVWQGSSILQGIRKFSCVPEHCLKCQGFAFCGGGCRSSAFNYSKGNLQAADPQSSMGNVARLNERIPLIADQMLQQKVERINQAEQVEKNVGQLRPQVKGRIAVREENFGKIAWNGFNYLVINDSGPEILDQCTGEKTIDEIVDYFVECYQQERDLIRQGVVEFIKQVTLLDFLAWK